MQVVFTNNIQQNDDTRIIRELESKLYPMYDVLTKIKKYLSVFKIRSHLEENDKQGLDKAIDIFGDEITKILQLLEKAYDEKLDMNKYKPLEKLDYKEYLQFQLNTLKKIEEKVKNGEVKITFDKSKLVDNYYYALAVIGFLIGKIKQREELEKEAKIDILEKDKQELLKYFGFIFVIKNLTINK